MKLIFWSLLAVGGVGIMAYAYFAHERLDPAAPWSSGTIYVQYGLSDGPFKPIGFHHLSTMVRERTPDPVSAALIEAVGARDKTSKRDLPPKLCEKLLRLDPQQAGISQQWLQSGRMPRRGHDEVLAGGQTRNDGRLVVEKREFAVVGVLRRDVRLFADCYLLPPDDSVATLFEEGHAQEQVHPAVLVAMTKSDLHDPGVLQELKDAFPPEHFTAVTPMVGTDRQPFTLYLAGEALALLGGSLALIEIYRMLAPRIAWNVLRDPLADLAARPKLLGAVHVAYFGLVIVTSAIVYNLPSLQTCLMTGTQQALASDSSPLGVVGKAYSSHNIPLAAAVTFAVNFFIASVIFITIPSIIVPGSGALLAMLRAALWGLLLAPTLVGLALAMLPHIGTLLLEGEAYILAAFFGLLVPVYMCEREKGDTVASRYGRAALLNLKALFLIGVVLLIAACYEAVEVILMSCLAG